MRPRSRYEPLSLFHLVNRMDFYKRALEVGKIDSAERKITETKELIVEIVMKNRDSELLKLLHL